MLSKSKCEVVLSGDYNIDLLKLNDNTNISDFFDTIISLTFYPIITLPTRFSDRRFNKIATQGAPQMAVDKEANSLSRVYSYYSKFNLRLFYV